ncbi:multiprotein-bridging factor 1 family protein [Actinomadura viridis]|uniref:helix-turn-helix domain-containing protein n=1 Tax=Actinomadura viridis TaxID=58110 RepID=UPI0036CB4B5B
MTFSEKLRELMTARGLGLRELARLAPCDSGYLAHMREGRRIPSAKLAERLDQVLDAGGELAALVPARRARRKTPKGKAGASIARRDVLALAGAAGLPRGLSGPVAPELADYFRDQLAGHYTADRHLGPFRLIPTAAAQYDLLCDLANAARGTLRPRLWSLAAGYAAFLGWLYQDGGNIDRSVYWHDVMLERAHRSNDRQLVAFALHNKAMLHADLLDGQGVLELTRAALQEESALVPKVRVLALQQTAHGISLTEDGDARDECDCLLDQAAALVDQIDDAYPWGGACLTPHYIDIQRATCLVRLGKAADALTLWERIMPSLRAAGARRDAGVFLARQAQAYAVHHEPEHAVTVAGEVVELANATGSERMRRELSALRTRMRPWAKEPPGRQLQELLSSMGGHT